MARPGKPLRRGDFTPDQRERFFRRIRTEPGPCWLIVGEGTMGSYTSFGVRRDGQPWVIRAHRVAWALMVGPLPPLMLVCHRCDNPPCVRPSHLFLGSNADNLGDLAAKGLPRSLDYHARPRREGLHTTPILPPELWVH